MADKTLDAPSPRYRAATAWLILAGMVAVELLIQFGATDPSGGSRFRFQVMTEFGFMDRNFDAWIAGGQADGIGWTFLSYLFVHAAPLHLAVNAALFLFVGPFLCRHIGGFRLIVLFFACGIGGAFAFGLTNDIPGPLVGGSAAIMGMFWAVKFWELKWIIRSGDTWIRYIISIVFLLALNVMMYWLSGGGVALEAHLGGAATGIVMAAMLSRRPPHGRFIF